MLDIPGPAWYILKRPPMPATALQAILFIVGWAGKITEYEQVLTLACLNESFQIDPSDLLDA